MSSKRKLVLLLVLAMVLSLFGGLPAGVAAEDVIVYLAFTSDVHYDTSFEQNNLEVWLKMLGNVVDSVDYMGFCGDLGSAYAPTTDDYWDYVQAAMDTADSFVDSGFIKYGNIYTFGNHEWYPTAGGDYENNKDNPTAKRLIHVGEAARTDRYIIYCFGAAGTSRDHAQDFLSEDIEILRSYLKTAPTDIPIIILTHFPLHTFSSRTSTNAAEVVELLNNYPNVIFLWGHNHNVYDTHYDQVFIAGDYIAVTDDKEMDINFTYAAAGCISDSEYTGGSAFVSGKGLLLAIAGSKVTFTYYDFDGNQLPHTATVDISESGSTGGDGPFTVKFKDGYSGAILDVQTVEKGGSATAPEVEEYEGYEFIGWNREFDNIIKSITVTALYEEKAEPLEPLAKQAGLDENFVYLSLYVLDEPAVGKSGAPIILYPVPWNEGMTVVDAVAKLHEMEYPDGSAGVEADNPYGFYAFTAIWGCKPEHNTLAFDSKNYVDAGKETKGGDIYYLLAYDSISDWLTTSLITPAKAKTVAGKYITMQALTMNMNPDYSYSPIGYAADIYVGKSLDSLVDTGIDSDDRGYFTLSFDEPGTYYVMARSDSCSDGIAIVEVAKNDGNYVYVNLSVDGKVMYDKEGNYIAYYPMVLAEGDTINDIMTELHAHAYGRGSAWYSYDSGGFCFLAGVWGLYNENNCGNIYLNNSDAPVSATTVLKNGDVLDINGYSDFATFAYYRASMFDKKYVEAAVGEKITLTAWRAGLNLETFEYDKKPNAAIPIYIDFKETEYVTDDNGQVVISFDKDGTYIVTGGTTPSSTCPICVVKVGAGGSMVKAKTGPDIVFSKQTIAVNGVDTVFEVYNIDGYSYFKLRDLAYVLNNTGSQFSVDYDAATRTVSCIRGEPYEPIGGELVIGEDKAARAAVSTHKLTVNGSPVSLKYYCIGGNNFFRLSDLANALKFESVYDEATGTGFINSFEKVEKGEPVGTVYFYAVTDAEILTDKEGKPVVHYAVPIYEGDTIADAITTLHELAYGDGYAWGFDTHSTYGPILTELWGKPTGSTAYGGGIWTDSAGARHADPTAPAVDGMVVYLNNFTDGTGFAHFRCGYFDRPYVELSAGESVTLTFLRSSGDGSAKPVANTAVAVNGEPAGTTDDNGQITLSFAAAGEYLVTGEAGLSWTVGVCYVVVK